MDSIWTRDIHRPSFKALKGNAITDVLIVGGGITGILCGYMMKNAGVDCMILEADRICNGVTQNTTAKITIQHGLFCNKQIKCYGEERARLYLKAQQRAFDIYAELCKDIPCDYEAKDSYVYSLNDPDKLSREVKALNFLMHWGVEPIRIGTGILGYFGRLVLDLYPTSLRTSPTKLSQKSLVRMCFAVLGEQIFVRSRKRLTAI